MPRSPAPLSASPRPTGRAVPWARALGLALLLAAPALAAPALAAPPVAAAPPIDDSLWERATLEGETAARKERYDGAMSIGYELGRVALALWPSRGGEESLTPAERARATRQALQAFRDAARVDPSAGEPHFYISLLLIYGRLECDGCDFEAKEAKEAIAAIREFERLSPLDPRLTASLLTKRAIYDTRLSGLVKGDEARAHLTEALATYRAILQRYPNVRAQSEVVYGNLAETLMMLGDVEGAIEQYRQALRVRPSTSVTLGLAVALDRDERGTEARALLHDLGGPALVEWEMQVSQGDVFYVPEGEVYYYRGLINEALGQRKAAIDNYNEFVASRAHPQFSARALANRDALLRSARP